MKEKILFIVNPISGHHDKSKFPSIVDELIDKDKYDYTIKPLNMAVMLRN